MTNSSKLELIMFDLDGTLIEYHHEFLYAEAERIIKILGHPPISREELESHFSDFDFFRFVTWEDQEAFILKFWEHFDWTGFPVARPFPSALDTMETLVARGFQLALVTARLSTEEQIRKDLEHTKFLDHLSIISSRLDESHDWTDKRPTILRACNAMGVEPGQAVMVGDIPADITSAKAVGVGRTIALTSGGIKREVLERTNPDHLLADISQLLSIFIPD